MIAQVVVDIPNDAVDRVFDYIALENTQIGMRVKVPFAGRLVLGYVIQLSEKSQIEPSKLKTIAYAWLCRRVLDWTVNTNNLNII